MKKQMKLLLFALLVVLLVATMAVVVSAAGDATYTEGTHYYKVTIDGTDNYYADLNAAIVDVPNGGTIYVLANVPAQPAVTLTKTTGFAYTITSEGTAKYTITMTGGTTKANAFSLNEGAVTLKNLVLADGLASSYWYTLVYSTGNSWAKADYPTLTLDNVTAEFSSRYGIWMHQRCDLTVKDSTIKNTKNDGGDGDALRFNNGSGAAVVTLTNSILSGVGTSSFIFQSTTNVTVDGCTLVGDFGTNDYNPRTFVIKNSELTGRVVLRASAKDPTVFQTAVFENTIFNATGKEVIYFAEEPESITMTNCTLNLSGADAKLASSDTYLKHILATNLVVNYENGANASAFSQLKAGSTISSQTVKNTACFVLSNVTGSKSIGTVADLVALIKSDANYANFTIPETWQNITMDNDDLKIILSGDALAQQSGETPFISGTKGTLIAIAKGVTTYVEGTHFFKTAIEGTTYFYATLEDVLSEVVNDGTITLLDDFAMETPSFGVEKTYTFDGNGFSFIVTPVIHEKVNASGTTTSAIHVWAGYVTVKNLTLVLAEGASAPSALLYLQNPTNVVADVHLTLENFVAEFASTYGLWVQTPSMLTVKGDTSTSTRIQGGSTDTIRLQAGAGASIVTIENGKFVSPNVFVRPLGNGAKVTINNGEFDITRYGLYLNDSGTKNNTITINDGTFTIKNREEDESPAQYFVYMNNANVTGNKIYFNGGEFTVTQTTSGCFVYIYNGTDNEFIFTGGTINCSASGDYNVFRNVQKNHFTFPAGGTFVVNADKANKIFMLNGGGSGSNAADSIIDIQSGTFDGGLNWFFSNKKVILKIGGTAHFKDTNKTLDNSKNNPTRYIGGINLTTGTVYVTGGVIETNSKNALCCAIYVEGTGTIDVSGGVLKGSNNVIRVANGATVNISGGSLTNIGAANQLIRVNRGTAACTINIKEGANLVQNQDEYVVYVQVGVGIINMTGGTVVANGAYAPFGVAVGADSEFKMSGGTVVAAQNYIVQMSAGKTFEITGGVIVMKNGAESPKAKLFSTGEDFTGTPVVEGMIVLFNATGEFGIGDVTVPAAEFAPSLKFGGESYSAYFANKGSEINKAGAEIYITNDDEGNMLDGIRFTSKLSADVVALVAEAIAAGKTVSYGTVIAPADYVIAAGKFTMAALDKAFGSVEGKLGNDSVYANIPAVNSLRDADKDGVYESFSGMLVNIKEANYGRAFAAVGYVVIDGEIIYSAFNTVDNARSAKYIATVLLESDYYEGDTTAIAILNKYAGIVA